MQVKCDFCGSMVDESNETCTKCGAPLSGAHRTAKGQPKTIEELRAWYIAHHLPPEEITRFFIGKNITEPKAFGIYRDSYGDFVVYKNKSTGERAIRYQGSDEQYAVNELYQRLKAEIADQKGNRPASNPQQPLVDKTVKKKKKRKGCLFAVGIFFVVMCLLVAIFDNTPPNLLTATTTTTAHNIITKAHRGSITTKKKTTGSSPLKKSTLRTRTQRTTKPTNIRANHSKRPVGMTQVAIAMIPAGTATATGTVTMTRGTAAAPTGIRTGRDEKIAL